MTYDQDNPPWTRAQITRGRRLAVQKRRGRPPVPHPKVRVTMRLDERVLAWFRAKGDGYQTRINDALHEYIVTHKR